MILLVHVYVVVLLMCRGYDFIWNNLQLSDVQAYWLQLLTDYAALLQYKPQLAEDMIEISP